MIAESDRLSDFFVTADSVAQLCQPIVGFLPPKLCSPLERVWGFGTKPPIETVQRMSPLARRPHARIESPSCQVSDLQHIFIGLGRQSHMK